MLLNSNHSSTKRETVNIKSSVDCTYLFRKFNMPKENPLKNQFDPLGINKWICQFVEDREANAIKSKETDEKLRLLEERAVSTESRLEFYWNKIGTLETELRSTLEKLGSATTKLGSLEAELKSSKDELGSVTKKLESSENKVKALEQSNLALEQKLSLKEVDSSSKEVIYQRQFLKFHHKMLESKELLFNQNASNILFIRTTKKLNATNAKKQLISAIEKSVIEDQASIAKKSIQNVAFIKGKSFCLRVELYQKFADEFVGMLQNNKVLLEQNGVFANRNLTKSTRVKNTVLRKIASKLQTKYGKGSVSIPRFEFDSSLLILSKTSENIASFKKMSYLDIINDFGYLLENEPRFCTKMHWLLGKSMSEIQKKATILI